MALNRDPLEKSTMTESHRNAIQLAWGRVITHNDLMLPHNIVRSFTMSANGTTTEDDVSAIASGNWTE